MADAFSIGLSALLAQQRALATTSNNIANANTPGYSRQRVELNERPLERIGASFVGTGVEVGNIRRLFDDLLAGQLRSAASGFNRLDTFSNLAASLDNLLADSDTGISAGLTRFFNAVQDLADDPASTSARQVVLSEAGSLVSRFEIFDRRLAEVGREINSRLNASVIEINGLSESIADVNGKILTSGGAAGGQIPADLLDQRERLLNRLSELANVSTVGQADGTLSVFVGNGQPLVLGTNANQLALESSDFDPARAEIALVGDVANVRITQFLSGGIVGGLLDFQREMLDPARNELGRFAVTLTQTFNAQQASGLDLNGQLGADFFAVGTPRVFPAQTNTGGGTVTATIDDLSGLAATGYRLFYDGAAYSLSRADTGEVVTLTGTGSVADPLRANGIALVVSGAPAAGDQFQIEPLADAVGGFGVLISRTDEIAAAAPIRTALNPANRGDGQISAGEVVDVNDPGLLNTATIQFLTANTYSINGAGSFAYTSGGDITINGARFQISGTPQVGDEFVLEANAGGIGDNRNALLLASVGDLKSLTGGTASLNQVVNQVVTRIGAQTLQSASTRDAQNVLLNQATEALKAESGVNLDEEAADLLRYEQSYQAAAQVISVADSLFQTLLSVLRR